MSVTDSASENKRSLEAFIDSHVVKEYINFFSYDDNYVFYTPRKAQSLDPVYEEFAKAYENYQGRSYEGYHKRSTFISAVRRSKKYKVVKCSVEHLFVFRKRRPEEIKKIEKETEENRRKMSLQNYKNLPIVKSNCGPSSSSRFAIGESSSSIPSAPTHVSCLEEEHQTINCDDLCAQLEKRIEKVNNMSHISPLSSGYESDALSPSVPSPSSFIIIPTQHIRNSDISEHGESFPGPMEEESEAGYYADIDRIIMNTEHPNEQHTVGFQQDVLSECISRSEIGPYLCAAGQPTDNTEESVNEVNKHRSRTDIRGISQVSLRSKKRKNSNEMEDCSPFPGSDSSEYIEQARKLCKIQDIAHTSQSIDHFINFDDEIDMYPVESVDKSAYYDHEFREVYKFYFPDTSELQEDLLPVQTSPATPAEDRQASSSRNTNASSCDGWQPVQHAALWSAGSSDEAARPMPQQMRTLNPPDVSLGTNQAVGGRVTPDNVHGYYYVQVPVNMDAVIHLIRNSNN